MTSTQKAILPHVRLSRILMAALLSVVATYKSLIMSEPHHQNSLETKHYPDGIAPYGYNDLYHLGLIWFLGIVNEGFGRGGYEQSDTHPMPDTHQRTREVPALE
jgi:hypothetical protein